MGRPSPTSEARPADAAAGGSTFTRVPVRTYARWLGAKRGANSPSLISRVTAKRLNTVGGKEKAFIIWEAVRRGVDVALRGGDAGITTRQTRLLLLPVP